MREQVARPVRVAMVERGQNAPLPLTRQAKLLGLSRASLYYQPITVGAEKVRLKHRIDEIYTENPFYGSRRRRVQLRQDGFVVNRKAVQRHLRETGLEAIYPGPNLSKRYLADKVCPYLLCEVKASYPNHVWESTLPMCD